MSQSEIQTVPEAYEALAELRKIAFTATPETLGISFKRIEVFIAIEQRIPLIDLHDQTLVHLVVEFHKQRSIIYAAAILGRCKTLSSDPAVKSFEDITALADATRLCLNELATELPAYRCEPYKRDLRLAQNAAYGRVGREFLVRLEEHPLPMAMADIDHLEQESRRCFRNIRANGRLGIKVETIDTNEFRLRAAVREAHELSGMALLEQLESANLSVEEQIEPLREITQHFAKAGYSIKIPGSAQQSDRARTMLARLVDVAYNERPAQKLLSYSISLEPATVAMLTDWGKSPRDWRRERINNVPVQSTPEQRQKYLRLAQDTFAILMADQESNTFAIVEPGLLRCDLYLAWAGASHTDLDRRGRCEPTWIAWQISQLECQGHFNSALAEIEELRENHSRPTETWLLQHSIRAHITGAVMNPEEPDADDHQRTCELEERLADALRGKQMPRFPPPRLQGPSS